MGEWDLSFYDKYMINEYLSNPWNPSLKKHDLCVYQMKPSATYLGEGEGHDESYMRKSLCLEGLEHNQSGPIFKFCMTQQSQIWASFVLSNIWSSTHISDLPI
ncbi:unnamed protein product [Lupinus luteus]|uniref:Uncharacterized protein n=1 Tax=Lupinus luteus TaxID=3873 RepID=A0AAV1XBT1_LUPLU